MGDTMLYIIWGRENIPNELKNKMIMDSRPYFQYAKRPEWFEDDFVKKFLKDIDNTEVLFEEALKDYRGRGISPLMISTGCKTLCNIYFDVNSEHIFFGSQLGDNCLPYLVEIASKRDVTILLEHFADFPSWCFKETQFFCDGKPVDEKGYEYAFCDWNHSTTEEGWYEKILNCGL